MDQLPNQLGRLVEFDEKSREYPIRALIAEAKKPRSYTWRCDTWLDQTNSSSCVGHSWAHEIAARPAVDVVSSADAYSIYNRAQQLDQWPGEEPHIQGSSVIAGAKAVAERGRMSEYRWGFSLDDMIMAIGYKGPVVVGTNWYSSMFEPSSKGLIQVAGQNVGGHAYLVNGVSVSKRLFRIHNSWGRSWGLGGDAFISFDDMERLLHEQGECCIPVKRIRSY